jgi:outer membrane protein
MGAVAAPIAHADDNNWEIRVRAVYLDPANQSGAIGAPYDVPANEIHINGKVLPDVDFEYFFTPHWSSELLLTYPQTQNVTIEKSAFGVPATIGSFKHLPPILTAKYNFLPGSNFQPYIGVGVNFTLIYGANLNVPAAGENPPIKLTLNSNSVGIAGQAGFDYKLSDQVYLNADVKYASLSSNVYTGGVRVTSVTINPFLFGVGVGYRF